LREERGINDAQLGSVFVKKCGSIEHPRPSDLKIIHQRNFGLSLAILPNQELEIKMALK